MIRRGVFCFVLAFLAASQAGAQAAAPVISPGKLISRTVAGAATVDMAALPVLSAADMATPGKFSDMHPATGVSDAQFAALKQAAAQVRFGGASSLAPTSPMSPSGAASIFSPPTSKGFVGIDETCASVKPSDMALAISGSFVVQAVNTCFAVWDKSGVLQTGFPKSINTLFGLPANNFATGQFVTDPRLVFDNVGNRFVMTAIQEDFVNSRGFILIAISTTASPTGSWFTYRVQTNGAGSCPDFDTLGQGRKGDKFLGALAISFNVFSCTPSGFGSFTGNTIWFLSKNTMYTGAGSSISGRVNPSVNGVLLDTLQPVNVSDASEQPRALYAIASFNINFGGGQCSASCNGLVVFAYSNVMPLTGSPGNIVSGTVVGTPSSYSLPPDAPQSGVSNLIATGDTRISGMVTYVGGRMYATLNTKNGTGGSEVLAWQIHTILNDNGGGCTGTFTNACPTLTSAVIDQQIALPYAGSNSSYYGTMAPDREGNIAMVFNFSSSGSFGSTAYITNRVTQAPGAWHDPGLYLNSGAGSYTQYRWGDYTAIAVEYGSPNAFWFSGMFARGDGLWGTAIGKTGYTLSNQP